MNNIQVKICQLQKYNRELNVYELVSIRAINGSIINQNQINNCLLIPQATAHTHVY